MEQEEELDYMSADFITASETADIRPGLISNRTKQRKIEFERKKKETDKKNKEQHIPIKVLESERRESGLEQPIGPENKGFAMLQKMGFQVGTSLGSSNSGIKEPVSVVVKTDRTGLGREQVLKEIKARKLRYREKRKDQILSVEDFRSALSRKHRERETTSDLLKSEKVCFSLDKENGLEEPEEGWFWPQRCLPTEHTGSDDDEDNGDGEEEIEYEPAEKLDMLTLYLRKTYCYCVWCGVRFEDTDDMIASCPGATKDDH